MVMKRPVEGERLLNISGVKGENEVMSRKQQDFDAS